MKNKQHSSGIWNEDSKPQIQSSKDVIDDGGSRDRDYFIDTFNADALLN